MSSNSGDSISSGAANWQFSGDMVANFDKHIAKSVPLYENGHQLICALSDFFIQQGSLVYDVGCATGALLQKLSKYNIHKKAQFIGIDIASDMITYANKSNKFNNIDFICADALTTKFNLANMIICYYTVQFIPPAVRQLLINKLYQALNWGGALILFDKMRAPDARFQDIFSALYTDYKLQRGYQAEEIINKSRSLKGVLEPFSTQGNIDLLKRAGFVDFVSIQKYLAFEGILAIK